MSGALRLRLDLLRRLRPADMVMVAGLAGVCASGGPGSASPAAICVTAPRVAWLSAEEVESALRDAKLTLVQMRMADDKCYAVVARDERGRFLDLLVHPVTAEIVRSEAK